MLPYRCLCSRDLENLFMAGRNISVTHEALGLVRVMKTCGMMGEVVGKAAAVALDRACTPLAVQQDHWTDLERLLGPGCSVLLVCPHGAYGLEVPVHVPKLYFLPGELYRPLLGSARDVAESRISENGNQYDT